MKSILISLILSINIFASTNTTSTESKEYASLLVQTIEQKLPIINEFYEIRTVSRINKQIYLSMFLNTESIKAKLNRKMELLDWKKERKFVAVAINDMLKEELCFDKDINFVLNKNISFQYQVNLDIDIKIDNIEIDINTCKDYIENLDKEVK